MRIPATLLAFVQLLAIGQRLVHGATVYESATLGPTGFTIQQVLQGEASGFNVAESNYVGGRFHVDQTYAATRIGGHFVRGFADDSFFGAIVHLSGESDFPNSGNLLTPDVLGVAHLSFPNSSSEAFGELSATLVPGWYAVIFGSGQFQTFGWGGTINNGEEIGTPSYIIWQPGEGWLNLADLGFPDLGNLRLVVEGNFIPEPTSLLNMVTIVLFLWLSGGRHRSRN
jgi:hypothetical protein